MGRVASLVKTAEAGSPRLVHPESRVVMEGWGVYIICTAGNDQLQLCVLGPSKSLSVEPAGLLVCRCVGLLRDRSLGWDFHAPAVQQLPGALVMRGT